MFFHVIMHMEGKDMLKIEKKEYQNRTFRLPVSLIEKLGRIAQDKNISVNQLVVILC